MSPYSLAAVMINAAYAVCLVSEAQHHLFPAAARDPDSENVPRHCREDASSKAFNPKEGAEKFTFQAEVNRLMDIIIHSLYSNKVCCCCCLHGIHHFSHEAPIPIWQAQDSVTMH